MVIGWHLIGSWGYEEQALAAKVEDARYAWEVSRATIFLQCCLKLMTAMRFP